MSGNLYFEKRSTESYELVFDFTENLGFGEIINDQEVYVNDNLIDKPYQERLIDYASGIISYDEVFTYDPDIYHDNTVSWAVLFRSCVVIHVDT